MARKKSTIQEEIKVEEVKVEETAVEMPIEEDVKIYKHNNKEENRYTGDSIIEALKSVNIDSSYASRQAIWKKNNLKEIQGMDYLGLGQQNNILLASFKDGTLRL